MLRGDRWDVAKYGIPIPQIDQLAAAHYIEHAAAEAAQRKGSGVQPPNAPSPKWRVTAPIWFLRPNLLPDSARTLIGIAALRGATISNSFDDSVCGELIRATAAADRAADIRWNSRFRQRVALSFSKLYFFEMVLRNDVERGAKLDIAVTDRDRALALATLAVRVAIMAGPRVAAAAPAIRDVADRRLAAKARAVLRRYGHAHFVSDAATYRPTARLA